MGNQQTSHPGRIFAGNDDHVVDIENGTGTTTTAPPPASRLHDITWGDLKVDISGDPQKGILGRGSYGVVLRGKWNKKNPGGSKFTTIEVAIKVMTKGLLGGIAGDGGIDFQRICEQAAEEARVMHTAKSSTGFCENIVTVHGVAVGPLSEELAASFPLAVRPGEPAVGIVLELEAGGSLESLVFPPAGSSRSALSTIDKIRIACGMAAGLGALHSIGVIHGDVKPQNVLLSKHNPPIPRWSDFGLSVMRREKQLGDRTLGKSTIQQTRHVRGTPAYLAPEMIDFDGDGMVATASRSSDVFALAMSFYVLFTGQNPYDALTEFQVYTKVRNGDRPSLSRLPSDTPPELTVMIQRGWDHDRTARASATDCESILRHALAVLEQGKFDIFFSHRWAAKASLSHVHLMLAKLGFRTWYDQNEMGYDLTKSMTEGVANSEVFLAFLDSEYQTRDNCLHELREAKRLGKTMVVVFTEPDYFGKASVEVKTICDFKTKMFCDISAVTSRSEWASSAGPSIELLQELALSLEPLLKVLADVGCKPSLEVKKVQPTTLTGGTSGSVDKTAVVDSDTINAVAIQEEDRKLLQEIADVMQATFPDMDPSKLLMYAQVFFNPSNNITSIQRLVRKVQLAGGEKWLADCGVHRYDIDDIMEYASAHSSSGGGTGGATATATASSSKTVSVGMSTIAVADFNPNWVREQFLNIDPDKASLYAHVLRNSHNIKNWSRLCKVIRKSSSSTSAETKTAVSSSGVILQQMGIHSFDADDMVAYALFGEVRGGGDGPRSSNWFIDLFPNIEEQRGLAYTTTLMNDLNISTEDRLVRIFQSQEASQSLLAKYEIHPYDANDIISYAMMTSESRSAVRDKAKSDDDAPQQGKKQGVASLFEWLKGNVPGLRASLANDYAVNLVRNNVVTVARLIAMASSPAYDNKWLIETIGFDVLDAEALLDVKEVVGLRETIAAEASAKKQQQDAIKASEANAKRQLEKLQQKQQQEDTKKAAEEENGKTPTVKSLVVAVAAPRAPPRPPLPSTAHLDIPAFIDAIKQQYPGSKKASNAKKLNHFIPNKSTILGGISSMFLSKSTIVDLLGEFGPLNIAVALEGCNMIRSRYQSFESISKITCDVLVAVLKVYGTANADVARACCDAIYNITANNGGNRSKYGSIEGSIEALVDVLKVYGTTNATVAKACCGAVNNITYNNDGNRSKYGSIEGSIEALVDVLKVQGKNDSYSGAVSQCCAAIEWLCTGGSNAASSNKNKFNSLNTIHILTNDVTVGDNSWKNDTINALR